MNNSLLGWNVFVTDKKKDVIPANSKFKIVTSPPKEKKERNMKKKSKEEKKY